MAGTSPAMTREKWFKISGIGSKLSWSGRSGSENPGPISPLAEAPLPDYGTAQWRCLHPGYEEEPTP